MWAKGNHAGIKFERMVPSALVEAFEKRHEETIAINLSWA